MFAVIYPILVYTTHFSVYTCQRNCLFTVTILVNINDTPDPHLLIEKLGVGIAKLPLSDGLNYLNWCQRHSESLKIVCDAEQRHIPLSRGWTVIYENNDLFYTWPCCLSTFRHKLENRSWSYPDLLHPYHGYNYLKANAAHTILRFNTFISFYTVYHFPRTDRLRLTC
jgi:hypothetical protein